MNTQASDLKASVCASAKMTQRICALPAVATQDWCDQAAQSLLEIHQPSMAIVLIGNVEDDGTIGSAEATGVAGCYVAQVNTTLGRATASSSTVPIDSRDQTLSSLRASIAQASHLGWSPSSLRRASSWAATPAMLNLGMNWRHSALGQRWESVNFEQIIVGTIPLDDRLTNRSIIFEIGLLGEVMTNVSMLVEALNAALPILAERALLAVGSDSTDSVQWLTPREQLILQHLLLGKSVRQIATELGRSPHTVHDHVKSLHRKLNASSRGELVARALGHVTSDSRAEPQVRTATKIKAT